MVIDANSLAELEYEFCVECGKLVEESAIIFSDPKTKVMVCREHEALLEAYKQKVRGAIKKKTSKNKTNELN